MRAAIVALFEVVAGERQAEPWEVRHAQRELAAARAADERRAEKKLGGAVEHHETVRRAEAREVEATSLKTWGRCLERTQVDHRGRVACESCHRPPAHFTRGLEPHHLILGGRTDAVELVMALCADCHRLAIGSAHRSPRAFAQNIVIPWARAHGYPLPNRKEYRS